MLEHLNQAQSLTSLLSSNPPMLQREVSWLLKVAWNLALKCENNYKEMAELFSTCYDLCSVLPAQATLLKRQKSCQLMAAAAMLQVAGSNTDKEEKESFNIGVHVQKGGGRRLES